MSRTTPAIADIPLRQRPRERLLTLGPEPLADAELLAVLLGTGGRGLSALDLASCLLVEHDGPRGLSRILPEELTRRSGVGPAKASRVVAAFGLARRIGADPGGVVVASHADLAELVRPWLSEARRERVVLVVCDASLRVRRAFVVSEGSVDHCVVPVREILTAVLLHDGVCFAVAHNHPSGDVSPSRADRAVTERLAEAADAVGVDFLGHLVVAADRWAACTGPSP
jgi:DNA repair protein RadC